MQRKLDSFVINNRGIISKDLRKRSLDYLKVQPWEKHSFTKPTTLEQVSYEDDLEVLFNSAPTNPELMQICWDCIYTYISTQKFSWFDQWTGYSQVRYNRYSTGMTMNLHCDHIFSLFDGNVKGIPILTLVGLLNDDFEGGEFTMWKDPEKDMKLKAGDILVFPSNFLYPHKVNHVTSGVRYSFVSWVW